MAELLKHTGVVISVDSNRTATVEVMREHACTGCGEKSSCTMSDGNNVRITFKNANDLAKGDHVEIAIDSRSFFRSLLTVYAVPLVLMLVFAAVADSVQKNQLVTAASALAAPAVYFPMLKIFRRGKVSQTYRKVTTP
ncbi:SoxR reducing system RseC family protein [Seleniivibrio sp.]|uniref:SoxR reducing system RseC family protein n=1 Tax=Seleniivibrio sp. TaxID=2898801 RepID=UPI0025D55AE8|nr:SoxR reducing system RseC family protein [Seleniivibrio sp.]MCD8553167.1 SoxR reducing system RseC family protein [Seleniivibrio sp.]